MNEALYSIYVPEDEDLSNENETALYNHLHALKTRYADKWLHKGKWLTMDVAKEFSSLGKVFLPIESGQNIRTVRFLTDTLQADYGVTELEAFNIVRGYHLAEYVGKYYRIRHMLSAC